MAPAAEVEIRRMIFLISFVGAGLRGAIAADLLAE
jgi:predicted ATP-grasp superfamily ATP-dependent carboligase